VAEEGNSIPKTKSQLKNGCEGNGDSCLSASSRDGTIPLKKREYRKTKESPGEIKHFVHGWDVQTTGNQIVKWKKRRECGERNSRRLGGQERVVFITAKDERVHKLGVGGQRRKS